MAETFVGPLLSDTSKAELGSFLCKLLDPEKRTSAKIEPYA